LLWAIKVPVKSKQYAHPGVDHLRGDFFGFFFGVTCGCGGMASIRFITA
jgi:hypothetical protein